MNTDIPFADNLDDMISGSFDRYCTHALCREGEASFLMTGEWFRMRKGIALYLLIMNLYLR